MLIRKNHISEILSTIEKTILKLEGKIKMNHEELYAGLPKDKAEGWLKIAKEKWPEQVEQAEKKLLEMNKTDFQSLKSGFEANIAALYLMKDQPVDSPEVQVQIANHYQFIQKFWGCTGEIIESYKGLGQLYIDDPAYSTVDGVTDLAFSEFMRNAMHYYADSKL